MSGNTNSPRSGFSLNKRQLEVSPTEDTQKTQLNKKVKDKKMAPSNLESTLNAIQNQLNTISSSITSIQNDVSALKTDYLKLNETISRITVKMESLEKTQKNSSITVNQNTTALNILQQRLMASEMIIYNVPYNIGIENILSDLSDWSGFTLNETSIKDKSLVQNKKGDKNLATLFIEFYAEKLKTDLMKMVKGQQRDENGKYNPITCESIFQIGQQDPCRGKELQFHNNLTEANRKILSIIRKNKDICKFFWIKKGCFLVRKSEDAKAVKIGCMEHLEAFLRNHMQ